MRMMAVSVGGFHHQHIRRLAFGGAGVYHFARRDGAVAHAANVSCEEQGAARTLGGQGDLRHGRAQDVRRPHKAEAHLIGQLHGLAKGHRTEARETLLRLFHGVQGKGGGVLGTFLLIVERRIFFLQITGVRQNDAA